MAWFCSTEPKWSITRREKAHPTYNDKPVVAKVLTVTNVRPCSSHFYENNGNIYVIKILICCVCKNESNHDIMTSLPVYLRNCTVERII